MKLPRWLVILLLSSSLLAVLAAAGWWWVTWPERTAGEFARLLVDRREGEAEKMLLVKPADRDVADLLRIATRNLTDIRLHRCSRSTADFVLGRQELQVVGARPVAPLCGFGGLPEEPQRQIVRVDFVVLRDSVVQIDVGFGKEPHKNETRIFP